MVGTISHDFVTNADRLFNFGALVPACRYFVVEAREQLSPCILFSLPDSEQRWKVMRGRRNNTAQVANVGPDWLFRLFRLWHSIYSGIQEEQRFSWITVFWSKETCYRRRLFRLLQKHSSDLIKITTLNNYSLSKYSILSCASAVLMHGEECMGKKKREKKGFDDLFVKTLCSGAVLRISGRIKEWEKEKHARDRFHRGDKRQDESVCKCHNKLSTKNTTVSSSRRK